MFETRVVNTRYLCSGYLLACKTIELKNGANQIKFYCVSYGQDNKVLDLFEYELRLIYD